MKSLFVATISLLVALTALVGCEKKAVETWAGISADMLPICWELKDTYHAGTNDVESMAARFGARVSAIDNVKIDAAGIPLQVNIVVCPSNGEAKKTYDYFLGLGQPRSKFVLAGNQVYEFICDNNLVSAKMKDILGVLEKPVRRWQVEMEVAPLGRGHDDMDWNDLYVATSAHHRTPHDEDALMKILDLSPGFEFSNTLPIRMEAPTWGAPQYEFTPTPKNRNRVRDVLELTFDDLPVVVDVPRVKVKAVVATKSFADYIPETVDKYLCVRKTDPWPMSHDEVRKAITECVNRSWSDRKNMEAMLCWVYKNIEFRGDEVGSRYGTIQVLRQRYGHCWDKADAFIAMCRLVEFPARMVFGWLNGQGGHVWAQVYFDDEGWISVDPTCSWVGVTDDYIPLFISEDGHVPFVYTMTPVVTPLD
jgi:hypothetical protein